MVNFDFPRNIEEYVHRVGRTGRAGKTGTAISFMERKGGDWKNAKELIEILTEARQEVPQELHDMNSRYENFKERQRELRGPNSLRGAGTGRGCFRCGHEGHFSRDCPGGQGGGSGSFSSDRFGGVKDGCFKCGLKGHFSRDCPNARGGRGGSKW